MNDSPAPIILIGAARSGTKFLRDTLAAADGIRAVPYDVNYVWRFGAPPISHDVLDPTHLTERRRGFIRHTIRKLAKAAPEDRVIEKTVSNSLRVPFVEDVFPEARYVHLIRDGRDVTESAMRQWQARPDWPTLLRKLRDMPLANAGYVLWFSGNFARGLTQGRAGGKVWGPRFPGMAEMAARVPLVEICARQWVESITRATDDLAGLRCADERVFTIRYEDLVRDRHALAELVTWLGLENPDAVMRSYSQRVETRQSGRWRDLEQQNREMLGQTLAPALDRFGYFS